MAPLSRAMHLAGQGVFAIIYGLIRALFLYAVCAFLFFDLATPNADYFAAFVILVVVVDLVHRHRDDDVGAAADLAPRRARSLASSRRGRCSSSRAFTTRSLCCPSGCSGSRSSRRRRMRSTGFAPRSSTARSELALERHLAAAVDRRHLDPPRALDLRAWRAVRKAARKAQAKRMSSRPSHAVHGRRARQDVLRSGAGGWPEARGEGPVSPDDARGARGRRHLLRHRSRARWWVFSARTAPARRRR